MKNIVNVGIDVSKDTLDFYFLELDKHFTILNNKNSILGLLDSLKSGIVYRFGYESTSNYMLVLQKVLTDYNQKQVMLNPFKFHHFLKLSETRKKNDLIDSKNISIYISTLKDDDFNTTFNNQKEYFKKYKTSLELCNKMIVQIKNLQHSQENFEIE